MEDVLRTLVSHEALASWVAALASFAAVFWGVWQVSRDARERRAERKEHTHETISCAEDVLITWDKLASAIKELDRDPKALADFTNRLGAHRLQLRRCIDTLELLALRPSLSDGAIKCAVQAKYLAIELDGALSNRTGIAKGHLEFQEVVRRLLTDIKRIRKSHRIRARSITHIYLNFDVAAIESDLEGVPPKW